MALIKCFEPECNKMVSDKAMYCPGCGHPVASEVKKRWETTPEGIAELAANQLRAKQKLEEQAERERAERAAKEEAEKARKLQKFKEIREKLDAET